MAFKAGLVFMAPDGDPKRHRVSVKTSKLELTTVLFELMNFDQAVNVCRDLFKTKESNLQSFAVVSPMKR